ncbi:hypothetical protein [Streptomyces armeniacus]|uniref:hypothetical protein n=1 Tax=Streptomyces armeniacus TaxID=83291 RepID=UPI001FE47986|nr:hypothetical protein [Streptomyces armeniacus]
MSGRDEPPGSDGDPDGGQGPHGSANGPDNGGCGRNGQDGTARAPRIPPPRRAAEDGEWPVEPDAQEAQPSPHPRPEPSEHPGRPEEPDAEPRTESRTDAPADPPAESRTDPRTEPRTEQPVYDHGLLKSLLGAWALAACSAEETSVLESHLTDCAACADEALRLRDAVGLLHPEDSLDLDPMLRSRVLNGCLGRRPARVPIPEWAAPYDAETARLEALLHDMAEAEWRAPVRLRWFDGRASAVRETTVAGVIGHLLAVDGMVAVALGLPDPLAALPLPEAAGPAARTEALWRAGRLPDPLPGSGAEPGADTRAGPRAGPGTGLAAGPGTAPAAGAVRDQWRGQGHSLLRTVSFAGRGVAELDVSYQDFTLPVKDAFLERAFECWVHAGDIAEAVDYPYEPPAAPHLNLMVDLAARQLPGTIAHRRRAGLAAPARRLSAVGAPGRTLHLEVEGAGGGHWYIPLDSPGTAATPEAAVAHVALDGAEFCQLAAGHVPPQEAAAGQDGDREAIRDVLYAAASLSRL